ncbi:hypothetical protein [Streptomyces sp. NPDC001536]|uniref:hypothetical protein n=1 Tax=Streptomyces sp. NPDC001536 TaxID=3364583 RepID=UPI0036A59FA6
MLALTGSVLLVVDVVLGRVEGDRGQCDAVGVRRSVGGVAAVRQAAHRTVRGPGRFEAAGRMGLSACVSTEPPRLAGVVHLPDFLRRLCFPRGGQCGRGVRRHVQQPFGDLPELPRLDPYLLALRFGVLALSARSQGLLLCEGVREVGGDYEVARIGVVGSEGVVQAQIWRSRSCDAL